MYISGVIGDVIDLRKLLSVAYVGMSICYFFLWLAGHLGIDSEAYFYIVFFFVGLFGSAMWPSYIAIMGNWFPKKSRGFMVGLWATSPNVGNIIGL